MDVVSSLWVDVQLVSILVSCCVADHLGFWLRSSTLHCQEGDKEGDVQVNVIGIVITSYCFLKDCPTPTCHSLHSRSTLREVK